MILARDEEESKLCNILDECLRDFPNIEALRKGQQEHLVDQFREKLDISALSTPGESSSGREIDDNSRCYKLVARSILAQL